MRARRRLATVALGLVAACALTACTSSSTASSIKVYPVGKRPSAPAIDQSLLGGGTFSLASELGHVVVINFWGSWCGPCRAEAADLESTYKSSGVVFVGVNVLDQQGPASAFVSARGITYPSIFDPAGRVMLAFRDVPPTAIPTTIVIDATGKVAALDPTPITSAQLTSMITAAQASS
jgi:thiol-disulfide isomerase/thioredoxin